MNSFDILQRASLFGLAALTVALLLQWALANRVPASWRVWIWRVALIQTSLALVPLAPITLSVLPARAPVGAAQIAPMPSVQTQTGEAQIAQSPMEFAIESPSAPENAPTVEPPVGVETSALESAPTNETAPASETAPIAPQLAWRELVMGVYGFGIALQLALLGRNALRVRRALRDCTPLDNAVLRPVAARLRIRRLPRLSQSAGGSPFLAGIARPTIVVPQTLSKAHLEAVLAHELAHLRRRDLAWNALLWLLQTALWFHPLTFAARRFHALEVESACDELTLQTTKIAPKSYGALLVNSMNKQNSPLTAGVNDGFFALKTRLHRLGRAPVRPRKRVRWAFGLALLVSFGAVVPIRLTARAQSEARLATELSGTVKDASGQSVAGATVYLARKNSAEPLETTKSDTAGHFEFTSEIGEDRSVLVWADAGARGLGQNHLSRDKDGARIANAVITPLAPVKLLLVAPDGMRAANLRVRVGQMGPKIDEQWIVPRPLAQKLQTQTNARGEAVFAGLPVGQIAQFWLNDQKFTPNNEDYGDLRGGQYAPVALADAVEVGKSKKWKTIRLVAPVTLRGRVTTPTGVGKSGALVTAQPISFDSAREYYGAMMVAQTRADSNGNYEMKGLRPGRQLIEVEPEAWLARDYVSRTPIQELKAPVERVDLRLIRGGIIRGTIRQKGSKKPLAGQTVSLLDDGRKYQYQKTDAQGRFQFRAVGGWAYLWTQNGTMPTRFFNTGTLAFEAKKLEFYEEKNGKFVWDNVMTSTEIKIATRNQVSSVTDATLNVAELVRLPVKAGATREITIESALQPVAQPVTGTVVGPDGKPRANALISVEGVSPASPNIWRGKASTDANGRFEVPARLVKEVARLFARDGADADLVTARGTVVRGGDDVTLQLEANVYGAAQGQITDEKTGRPLPGVAVICYAPADSSFSERVTTGADGRFRFERLRPFQANFLQISKRGYEEMGSGIFVLQKNETKRLTIALPPHDKTLSGRVMLANGQSAGAGYTVMVWTGQGRTKTKADGSFVLPQVLDSKFTLSVIAPDAKKVWTPYWTRGGRTGVTLQLTDARLDLSQSAALENRTRQAALGQSQIGLIGKVAPLLRAKRWVGTPPSFANKVTLIQFAGMSEHSSALNDFARAFGSRGVQVVGIKPLRLFWETEVQPGREEYLVNQARDLGLIYPVAIDQPAPNGTGLLGTTTGQTQRLYRGARFVIVGRDGEVKWVGGDPGQAIAQAAKLAA